MMLRRNTLTRLAGAATLIAMALLIFQATALYQDHQVNQQVALLSKGELVDPTTLNMASANVRIAYAHLQGELLLFDQAVETYSATERFADHKQRRQIFYNLGNLYLTQAIAKAENLSVDRATAMADVAKDFYRSALELDPDFWLAKFNYEAAQRLSRDLPLGEATISEESQEQSDELWSAMPGFPVGLP